MKKLDSLPIQQLWKLYSSFFLFPSSTQDASSFAIWMRSSKMWHLLWRVALIVTQLLGALGICSWKMVRIKMGKIRCSRLKWTALSSFSSCLRRCSCYFGWMSETAYRLLEGFAKHQSANLQNSRFRSNLPFTCCHGACEAHDLYDLFPCFCCFLPVFSLLLLSVYGLGVRIMATVKASLNWN